MKKNLSECSTSRFYFVSERRDIAGNNYGEKLSGEIVID